MSWPNESVSIPAPTPPKPAPVRIVFGPTGRDRVQVILPDGRDIAPEMLITSIDARVRYDGHAEVTLGILGAEVEVLTAKVTQDCRDADPDPIEVIHRGHGYRQDGKEFALPPPTWPQVERRPVEGDGC